MSNYFNSLPLRTQLQELGKCRFMDSSEFEAGITPLAGKTLVIIGCGAQGFNQGLNLRDSGLNVSYALRKEAIEEQRPSWVKATEAGFQVGTYDEMVPNADMVLNLTPDKQHTAVVTAVMPLMKEGACLSYSHGFNIVEEGMKIREDLTVIMVAPKCPGTEVREEYLRGFGVPTLIAVHLENDPQGKGLELAKAYAAGTGGHRAGVLESSFVAEVKSDLMGEQTILCGMLQTGSLLCFDRMVELGIEPAYAAKLVQYGWETVTEGLKQGGITNMMDRLSNPAKIRAFDLAEEMKGILRPLFEKHQDDIMSALDANPARRPPPSHSHPHPAPIVPTHPHAHRLPTTERHAATSRCRGREAFRVLPVAAGGGRRRAGGRGLGHLAAAATPLSRRALAAVRKLTRA